MASSARFLLQKIRDGLSTIQSHYAHDLAAQAVSDELLYAVRGVIQDSQSALDFTASAVAKRYLPPSDWSPYFPLGKTPQDFQTKVDKQLPGLRTAHPTIAAAFERHQPYQRESRVLAHLPKLSRVNKHQDFSPQVRAEHPRIKAEMRGGGSVEWSPANVTFGHGVSIGGVPVNPATQLPASGPSLTVSRLTYVEWRFLDPPVAVSATLHSLSGAVRAAVYDIESAAGL